MNKHFNLLQVSFPPLATCLLQKCWEGAYFLNTSESGLSLALDRRTAVRKIPPPPPFKAKNVQRSPLFLFAAKESHKWRVSMRDLLPVTRASYSAGLHGHNVKPDLEMEKAWIFLPPVFPLPSKVEANKAQILTIFTFFPAHHCSSQEQSLMAIFITLVKTHNFKKIGEELSGEYMSGMG